MGSVQSTAGSRGVRISGSNAGYTMFLGSVKSTGHPLHSPVSPSLPLIMCHHISTGVYDTGSIIQLTQFGGKNRTTTMQCMFGEVWHTRKAFSPCFRNTLHAHFKGRSEYKLVRRFSMNSRQKRRTRYVLQLTYGGLRGKSGQRCANLLHQYLHAFITPRFIHPAP